MSVWTTISNALVAVGAKPFATTIQALRDNPIAIVEGAQNAPRPRTVAQVLDEEPLIISAGDIGLPAAGYTGGFSSFARNSVSSTSFVSTTSITITNRITGTFRFSASLLTFSGSSSTVEGRLMKNGSQVQIWSASGDNVTFPVQVDATGAVGDVFLWEVRLVSGTAVGISPSAPTGNKTVVSRSISWVE